MSPGEWFGAVRRAWMGMLAVLLVCVAGSGVLLLVTPPAYEASAEIVFTVDGAATNPVPRTVATNAAVRARSDSVLAGVADEFDVDRNDLSDRVSATWVPETSMTAVTVSDADPRLAAELATAIAEAVASQDGEDVRARAYDAAVPESPVRPRIEASLAVGALLGIALSFVYAALRFILSTRLRSLDDAADLTGLPAYAWPSDEPTPEQIRELQLVSAAWAGERTAIALVPLDSTTDTASAARFLAEDPAGATVVELAPLRDGVPGAEVLRREEALVLVVEIGVTSRRAASIVGHLRREGATNLRGVIVLGTGTGWRALSAMSEPANGERA